MKTTLLSSILVAAGLMVGCNETNREVNDRGDLQELAAADTAVMYGDLENRENLHAEGVEVKTVNEAFWNNIDFNAPVTKDANLTGSDIEKRRGDGYDAYTMDERILFDLDKAKLRQGAEDKLKSIAQSIQEEHPQGQIRIFGHTDSIASKSYNKQLGQERAKAVKEWFQNNTDIDASRISTHSEGQTEPRATNETAEGRQKNRRVAIVVASEQQNQGQNQMSPNQQRR